MSVKEDKFVFHTGDRQLEFIQQHLLVVEHSTFAQLFRGRLSGASSEASLDEIAGYEVQKIPGFTRAADQRGFSNP